MVTYFCKMSNTETVLHQISMLSWKLKINSSAHVSLISVKIFHHYCACGKHGTYWNICPPCYHQNVPCMHMFGIYLVQIEVKISIVMCRYEYNHVFITILFVLITLQDKFLPIERNLKFCILFHLHLDKLVDGARKNELNFPFDCNRQV